MAKATRYMQEIAEEYLAKGYWTGETTAEMWDRNAEVYPDKEALIDSRNRLTWRQAKVQSDSIALSLLDMDFKRDEIIFILLPNCIESYVIRLCKMRGNNEIMDYKAVCSLYTDIQGHNRIQSPLQ